MLTREDDRDVHALHRTGWTSSAITRTPRRDRRPGRADLKGREDGEREGRPADPLRGFRGGPLAPLLGRLLGGPVRAHLHHGVVDLALGELHAWLRENPDTVAEILGERAPWWTPPRLNDVVTSRINVELVRWVGDIRSDPHHHARRAFASMLAQLARDLLTDPDTQAQTEARKEPLTEPTPRPASPISLSN